MKQRKEDLYKQRKAGTQTIFIPVGASASDMQMLINSVPKYVPYGKTITFQFVDGTHTLSSSLSFNGFEGSGTLVVCGNTTETNATSLHTTQSVFLDFSGQDCYGIQFSSCNLSNILVRNLKIKVKTGSADYACIYTNYVYSNFRIFYNYLLGNSTSNGFGMAINSNTHSVYGLSNYFGDIETAIIGSYNSNIFSSNNDDVATQPKYGLNATNAATIGKRGTQPAGSVANESTSNGGVIV
jgi:hypothetical protein